MADMPLPPEADRDRWEASGLMHRILCGEWAQDAEDRLATFFDDSVRDVLPDAETSRNVAASVVAQIATVYDEPPVVKVLSDTGEEGDADEVDGIGLVADALQWAQMQHVCYLTVGLNDCLVRMDLGPANEDGRRPVVYREATPDRVVTYADPKRPDQPVRVDELRERVHPESGVTEWVWEVWDTTDPTKPKFRLETSTTKGDRIDVTAEYLGAEGVGWPADYVDTSGAPVLPYVAYHRRVNRRMWSPRQGSEMFWGTLTTAALWTMWIAGVRDASYPQRGTIDARLTAGHSVNTASGGNPATQAVRASPAFLLMLASESETKRASTFQWQPGIDPATLGAALEQFEAGLAQYAGISPADLHRGSQGASGYSIVVSRDGQRKAQKRLIPPFRASDQLRLATAARLCNRANGTALPETSSRWSIEYASVGASPEEQAALVKLVADQLNAKLISRHTAIARLNPEWTSEQVEAEIARIDGVEPEPPETATTPRSETDDSPDDSMAEELDAMLETLDALETAGADSEMLADLRASVREVVSMRGAGRGR